jgi:phospholipase A1
MQQYRYLAIFALLFLFWGSSVHGQEKELLLDQNNSSLSERWLLDKDKVKSFKIMPYKPVYVIAFNYIDDINNLPQSDNPINTVKVPTKFENAESSFQLSFKTRIGRVNASEKTKIDFWVAYTQLSKWQVYNGAISRPFRETNYEPEFLVVFPVNYKLFGLEGVYFAAGINHQSNGKSNPYSRSWNRITFQTGWERKNWSIVLNPWIRLHEEAEEDNNPDIEDYVGRAELLTAFSKNKHNMSLALRHSLRFGDDNRGSLRFQYNYQLMDNLFAMLQVFHGYGENMIDYNHKQTTIGVGVSLLRWR